MDLNTFLAWFSGYSENIKQKPTVEQWKRIKAEIAAIDLASVAKPVVVHAAPAAPAPAAKKAPTTKSQWLAQYKEALMEDHGMDPESANEFMADTVVDMNRDPALAAKADLADMTRN